MTSEKIKSETQDMPQNTIQYECCNLGETASKIADTFQAMVMARGFNAVSYGDLAKALGIRKASIHYHFPTKADLGVIVIKRYREQFESQWKQAQPGDPQSYIRAYESFIAPIKPVRSMDGISCLFGVLGAESQTLCPNIQDVVSNFFIEQSKWLAKVFEGGRKDGVFHFSGPAADFAKLYSSALQGAMLIKKSTGSPEYFDAVLSGLENMLYGK